MGNKPLRSSSFEDLSASFDARDEEDGFVPAGEHTDDPDKAFAAVDLNEADIDKAIDAGFAGKKAREDLDDRDEQSPRDVHQGSEERTPTGQGDEDDEAYGKKVRKRIERERRVSARERQARIEAERERDELRDRVGKIESKLSTADRAQVNAEVQGLGKELDVLETQLAKASEDGEHAEVSKLTRRMQEVAARKSRAEERIAGPRGQHGSEDGPRTGRERQGDAGQRKLDRRAEEFIEANRDWWDDRKHLEERKIIEAIDVAVTADGYRQDTDEYYVELARRVRSRGLGDLVQLPTWMKEEDADDRHDKGAPRPRRNGGPGGVGSGGAREQTDIMRLRREAAGQVTLTNRDRARMRQMRLDPSNKEHLRRWAEARRETAREELVRRG